MDYLWFLIILAPLAAAGLVKATFAKYNKVQTRGGRNAADIAREILDANGLHHVQVVEHPGNLTDHYDPRSQTVALSNSVYRSVAVGAIAVAAHEVGHAIQHATEYTPIKIRTSIFPLVNITSRVWIFVLLAGFMFEMMNLVWIAILLFSFGVLFQLITLPLEIDASSRAMKTITENGYLVGDEIDGARKTLTAAAFTYFVALVISVLQLLRLLSNARR